MSAAHVTTVVKRRH